MSEEKQKLNTYPLELIATGLTILLTKKTLNVYFNEFLRYSLLPYGLTTIGDHYLPLNRNYKPIGQLTCDWADYDKFPHLLLPIDNLDVEGLNDTYFYNDSNCLRTKGDIQIYKEKVFKCFAKYNLKVVVEVAVHNLKNNYCVKQSTQRFTPYSWKDIEKMNTPSFKEYL